MQPIDLTQTEENYLKAIYHLSSENPEVSTNSIAEVLATRPASVSDMLKKLAAKGQVNYVKYKGVSLTEEGSSMALWIIRKHRLWEVFLVEKLKFNWDEVHEVAEQLEHIKSRRMIEQLDKYLDYPRYDPHGDPIPDSQGNFQRLQTLKLSEAPLNKPLKVIAVKDSTSNYLRYLDKVGISIGVHLRVTDRIEYDGSVEVEIEGSTLKIISQAVSENLLLTE